MQIGSIKLSGNLFLAPLAGYTNLPMRLTLRELGGLAWVTTDLVNARSLIENNRVARKLVATCPEDQPMAMQLFGAVPEEMRDAAVICQELGASAIDINMGCPAPKVLRVGGGSAMMTEHAKTSALVRAIIDAVKIPVTVKMRLGWDIDNITAPELAASLEDAGISTLFIHGRTRAQGFSGTVSLEGIAKVVQAVKHTPVIGNGDVTTPESAKFMMEQTGCAGVAIGRAAIHNPWIFRQTEHFLKTGEKLPAPMFEENIGVMRRLLDHYCIFYGENDGPRRFRKVAHWYARTLGPSKYFRQNISTISNKVDFEKVIEGYREWRKPFCDESGKLLPRHEPLPIRSSFMPNAEGFSSSEIPVRKGPVEHW